MEYTQQEVTDELRELYLGPKTRVRHLTDKRYYLIALLYYKFKVIEYDIFNYTGLTNRSSIHHAKRSGAELYRSQDPVFMRNTQELIEKFPFDFPDNLVRVKLKPGLEKVSFRVSPTIMDQLKRYTDRKAFGSVNISAKHILTNLLKLWEE